MAFTRSSNSFDSGLMAPLASVWTFQAHSSFRAVASSYVRCSRYPSPARVAPSSTFFRTSGRCRAPRTASYCARVTVSSMSPCQRAGRGRNLLPSPRPRKMPPAEEGIARRGGISTRHWVSEGETGASLAREATCRALDRAGMRAADLDCIVYCTCTPDHFEPGNGVFLARELGLSDVPAIDVRNQCSGFVYGLSVADAWIRTGQYRRVLLVGAEVHSRGLDKTTAGRDTAVVFGDGAGVAILGPTNDSRRGVLTTHLYADGRHAEKLWVDAPGLAHDPFISEDLIRAGKHRAVMDGREVFKYASILMPQSVKAALIANDLTPSDVKLLVPHQANLRIIEMVQKAAGLRDDQVDVNIQKYGNTTAASIPIALHEALEEGRLARGDLLVLTAFGSGFTWGSAAIRW